MIIAGRRNSRALQKTEIRNQFDFLDLEEDRWRDMAACIGKPYEWFERDDEFSATREEVEVLHANIARGVKVCDSCPVTAQCIKFATPGDLAHTVRGGRWPTSISKKSRGVPAKNNPGEPRVFPGRKRNLTPDEVRVGNIYLEHHDTCEGEDKHAVRTLEHLAFKKNGVYIKARCRACIQDDNLEYKRRQRGTIDS